MLKRIKNLSKTQKMFIINIAAILTLLSILSLETGILVKYDLAFTHYITYTFIAVIVILSIITAIQTSLFFFKSSVVKYSICYKIKNSVLRFCVRILAFIMGLAVLAALGYETVSYGLLFAFKYKRAEIVKKNGIKMEAYIDADEITYYDYKNFFVRGKQVKLNQKSGE